MSHAERFTGGAGLAGRRRAQRVAPWTEAMLRQEVARFRQQVLKQADLLPLPSRSREAEAGVRVVEAIVRRGMRPDVLAALQGRWDASEVVRDLATSYAFSALLDEGQAFDRLDPLSQVLVQRTLDLIYDRAFQVAQRTGEDPLDAEPNLLLKLCKDAARYVPRRPMGAHISWQLQHYEGATSRAVRQIENLVCRPGVTDAFAALVLEAPMPDEVKEPIVRMARGGGRQGVNYEATIRLFARPETIAFVKQFAGTVQTARTLYDEDVYTGIPWQGPRRLPANRRQGYVEAALARLVERQRKESRRRGRREGDPDEADDPDDYPAEWPDVGTLPLRGESFEQWATRVALDAHPDDPLWRAAAHLTLARLPVQEIVDRGLASYELVTAARARLEELRADPAAWEAWMAATLG